MKPFIIRPIYGLARPKIIPVRNTLLRRMATVSSAYTSHIERTAQEPRDDSLHNVILTRIDEVNDNVRLLRLTIAPWGPDIRFLPGQWIDLHIRTLPKPGGFTITSTPSLAIRNPTTPTISPYLELAVQNSPKNPAAAYLWRPIPSIINFPLQIRIGGSFTWPPPSFFSRKWVESIRRIVFVAGGVGINPLISILGALWDLRLDGKKGEFVPEEICFLYSSKDPGGGGGEVRNGEKILFLQRLVRFSRELGGAGIGVDVRLFLTGVGDGEGEEGWVEVDRGGGDGDSGGGKEKLRFRSGRMRHEHLIEALGPVEGRRDVVCYVCGVPRMTDEFVEVVGNAEGMDKEKVLCERWW